MFCMPIMLYLLKCITETMQVTESRKYLPQGPHSDSLILQYLTPSCDRPSHQSVASFTSFAV